MWFETIATQTAETSLCQWGVVIGASLAAAASDLRTGRISNRLTLGLAGAGVIYAAWRGGVGGAGEAVLAWVIMSMPYIILFLLGRGGAGDAKMMGAIGAWLGVRQGLVALCCVALAGGALAMARVAVHAQRKWMFHRLLTSAYVFVIALASGREGWRLLRNDFSESERQMAQDVTVPYGAAIFLGVCLAAATVHLWIH